MSQTKELLEKALALHRRGAIAEAKTLYAAVLQAEPHNADALYYLGLIACQEGRFADGVELARKALSYDPRHPRSHVLLGRALAAQGQYENALASFDRALALAPDLAQVHGHRADVLNDLGRHGEAVEAYDRGLAVADRPEDWFNRGMALATLNRHAEAVASFERTIAGRPDDPQAHLAHAKSLSEVEKPVTALEAVDRALAIAPRLAEAWQGRGNVCLGLKRCDDALSAFDRALALKPTLAGAWLGRGNVLRTIKQHHAASAAYDKALSLDPGLAAAWVGRGTVLFELRHYEAALAAVERAIELDPGLAAAWHGRGEIMSKFRKYGEAFTAFDRAFQLDPTLQQLAGQRMYVKLLLCDWRNLDNDSIQLLNAVREGKSASVPFPILAVASSPADQLAVAQRYVQDQLRFPPLWCGDRYVHDRIRIAYLSADFGEHPVARLLVGLLERHDRSRFEVTAISLGLAESSPLRQRIMNAVDHFIPVADDNDEAVAALVRRREIDIVVDLMGFTENSRPDVLARRPAPIHVNYLGFIGTMGAPYIDYVIADEIALPVDQQPFFSEKIVHLPDCFLPTDDRQEIAARTPSRLEAGLPPEGFVFCSFNNSYKLNQPVFGVWMRLLQAVPGSVLWLTQSNSEMVGNLSRQAERCGVDPERIIFAPRVPYAEHLARQRLAGLFLDTTPYNAGATAVAALWAGVPVLTCLGETFVARMAASMLHALGLRELVTNSLAEYEALARRIASNSKLCAGLKEKLARNRGSHPLFDTARITAHIEQAYMTMVDSLQRGEAPRSFKVAALPQNSDTASGV